MTLVEELRRDRESGAKRLESEYKAGLMTLARNFCVDESDAEELVNRTFAAVVEGIDDYLEQSAFFSWMCQILKNIHALDTRRKSHGDIIYPGQVPEIADEYAQEEIYRNLDASLVREAIKILPPDQRETLLLHYFMDMPVAKIAKFLAIPVGTVNSRLHYARKALATKLGVKMHEMTGKPGGKAVLLALALCALTAVGAVWWGELSERAAIGETGETGGTGGTGGSSSVAPVSTPVPPDSPVPPVADVPFVPDVPSTTLSKDPTMNTTTLRSLAASAAFMAASAAIPASTAQAAVLAAATVATGAIGTTYTWTGAASGTWNTTEKNWSDGTTDGVAWVNNQDAPNDAVFGSASRYSPFLGGARYVNDLTLNGTAKYIFSGNYTESAKIAVAGTINVGGTAQFSVALDSLRPDGSLHLVGSKTAYVYQFKANLGCLQSSTWLDGALTFAPNYDRAFGREPPAPATNIFVTASGVKIFADGNVTIHSNRIVKANAGVTLNAAAGFGNTLMFKGRITADTNAWDSTKGFYNNSSRLTAYKGADGSWLGTVALDPGAGATNDFGRLQVESRMKVSSGTTTLTAATKATGTGALLYVPGNGSSFSDTRGNLVIDGGELHSWQGYYADVSGYGQVTVTNGGRVNMTGVQWLNGLSGPGRLTVADGGEFAIGILRLSQSGAAASEIILEEGGLLRAGTLYMDQAGNSCDFRFNGGAIQSIGGGNPFLKNTGDAYWTGVRFLVGEKGAVFNTCNGQNIWWSRPLVSGAAADGGVRKFGSGVLVFTATNAWNGALAVESGNVQVRVKDGIPPGTSIRLSAGSKIDFSGNGVGGQHVENWVGRLEGEGTLANSSNLHVTNSIATGGGGSQVFDYPCYLEGDYEVAGYRTQCGRIVLNGANTDISGLKVKLVDEKAFDAGATPDQYVILSAPNKFAGEFDESDMPRGCRVKYTETSAYLSFSQPFSMVIR